MCIYSDAATSRLPTATVALLPDTYLGHAVTHTSDAPQGSSAGTKVLTPSQ